MSGSDARSFAYVVEFALPARNSTSLQVFLLQCVAVCCNVPQRVAVCCRVLQCVAVCCKCGADFCNVLSLLFLPEIARPGRYLCCSVLQCVPMCHSS